MRALFLCVLYIHTLCISFNFGTVHTLNGVVPVNNRSIRLMPHVHAFVLYVNNHTVALTSVLNVSLPPNGGFSSLCCLSCFSCVVSSFRSRCLSLPALLLRIAGGACAVAPPPVLRMGGCDFFTLLACTSVFLATVACHTCTLTGALHLYAICQFIMIIEHASVVKTTNDRAATWRFVEMDGTFAVIGDNRKIIPCDNIDHMRSVYKRFIGRKYGFLPVK